MNELELVKQINNLQRQVDSLIKPEVGRWVDWTPTVTQSGAVTVTVTFAQYVLNNNTVHLRARLLCTSAGTTNNAIVIAGLPALIQPQNTSGTGDAIGVAVVDDAGGPLFYVGALMAISGNDLRIAAHGLSSWVGVTPNFALASGDRISFQATYEQT